MKLQQSSLPAGPLRGLMALVMLLLFLGLQLGAACEKLHREVCDDADSPEHACAITLVSHGQLDLPVPAILPVPAALPQVPVACPPSLPVPGLDHPLPPARGPPAGC